MKNKELYIAVEDEYRIVAISDVHGHKDILENLLSKVALKASDYLIILGDFINKGPDSYETYKFVRKLSNRDRTYILKGNHEMYMQYFLEKASRAEKLLNFIKNKRFENIIETTLVRNGVNLTTIESEKELLGVIEPFRSKYLEYFENMPVLIHMDDFTFVHGGYDSNFDIQHDEGKYLKYDNYNELARPNKRKVIVGHWPASNLRKTEMTNLPFYNDEKNIIFIDGGLGVKHSGELNAFVIEKRNGDIQFDCIQENTFESRHIRHAHVFQKERPVYVGYPDFKVDVLKKGKLRALCRHVSTRKEFTIFNDLLVKKEKDTLVITNYINNYLNLEENDTVEVCMVFKDCALVKHEGNFGWVLRSQIE